MNLAEGDVSNMPVPGLCFDPTGVDAVIGPDILKHDVFDIVWRVGILAHAPDSHSRAVACNILDMNVGAVPLDANAGLWESISQLFDIYSRGTRDLHRYS